MNTQFAELSTYVNLAERGVIPGYYTSVFTCEDSVATFMLHNLSGQLIGYQEYRHLCTDKSGSKPREESRYYTYVTKGQTAMWGLEGLNPSLKYLCVVEGTFKAAALHNLGLNAVALLTSTPNQDYINTLTSMPYKLFAIGDNDPSGHKLVKAIGHGIVSPKDLDEMTTDEIVDLLKNVLT